MVDVLHHEVVTELELREAIHGIGVDIRIGGSVAASGRRCGRSATAASASSAGRGWSGIGIGLHIGGGSAVFDAMAVISKRIGSGAVDAFAVVFLQAGEVA